MYKIEWYKLRSSIKSNIIYFVTLVICIALFYGFISLGDPYNPLVQGNEKYDFSMYAPMIRYCIYVVSISLFILVSYVNLYMFKEKLKDISVLITLGMKRSKIAIWYSEEMLTVSIVAFVIGIFGGIICSYVINGVLSLIAYKNIVDNRLFYVQSFVETCIFFAVIYCGITFINVIKVLKKSPLELLNNHKVIDSKRNSKFRIVSEIIVLLVSYIFIAYNLKVYFSLGRNYQGNIPDYESNKFQVAIFAAIILAIFLTIKIIAYLLIAITKKKILRYGESMFIVGKLAFRMRSNVRNMFLVTIVLTLSLCGFSLIPILAEFSKEYMEQRMVFDVNIPFNYDNIERQEDIPDIDYQFAKEILEENDLSVKDECILEEYFVWEKDFSGPSGRKNKYDMPRLAISISDYNKLREMAELEKIELEKDEFIYQVKNDVDISQFEDALKLERSLKVGNSRLKPSKEKFVIAENLGDYIYNTNTDDLLVFPDEVCAELKLAKKSYFANLRGDGRYQDCKNAEKEIYTTFRQTYSYLYTQYGENGNKAIDFIGPMRFISIEENDISFMVIVTKMLGIYIGIIFMVICMAMVSIKNIIECSSDIDNYQLMKQIGMSSKSIKYLNLKENLFFYFVPYFISIFNFYIIQKTFFMRFGKRVNVYFQGNGYVNGIMVPFLAVSIILLIYIIVAQIINFNKIDDSLKRSYLQRE